MLEIGSVIDRYELESHLGRGGMGSVYRAMDLRLRRPVALKVLESHIAADARALLLREARAAASLLHPNIVTVFDVGEARATGGTQDAGGVAYMAMELVEGTTLRKHIGTRLPMVQAVRWLMDTARGLAEAHRAGIVHRDIKPGNVMITPAGAKILDFGIAQTRPSGPNSTGTAPMGLLSTPTGFTEGTPKYMAPEQLFGGPVDARSDQFSWGLVAYELMTGTHPRGDAMSSLGWQAPPMKDVPTELAQIVLRALSTFPQQRHASMDDVAKALESHAGPAAATLEFRAMQAERPKTSEIQTRRIPEMADAGGAAESFREPDRTFLAPLVDSALIDIKAAVGDSFRNAILLTTVDVQGTKGRYFVQMVVVDRDDRIIVPVTSLATLLAAGELIGADARAGNGRWRQIIIRLGPRGIDPRGEIEVS